MRRWRIPLTALLFAALTFDVYELHSIWQFGWPPPDEFLDFDENAGGFVIAEPTARDSVHYGLFLLALAVVQLILTRMTWKAWQGEKRQE